MNSGIRRVALLSSLLVACARATDEQDQEVAASSSLGPGSDAGPDEEMSTGAVVATSEGVSTSSQDADVGGLGASSETGGDATGGAASSTTGEPAEPSDCCTIADAPGCLDVDTQACVCGQDPYCCDTAWDEACVNVAKYGSCGSMCATPTELGPCCSSGEMAGCEDDAVAMCVCAIDPYCCTTQWDDVCVGYVAQYACGSCD